MKVFITGATGVLGRHVVRQLLSEGHNVGALCRSEANSFQLMDMGVKPIAVDLFDPSGVVAATQGHDAIIHLATHIPQVTLPRKSKHWIENDRIRIEGTRNLLTAAVANQISVFIQPSIAVLYGDQKGAFVDSMSPISDRVISMARSAAKMEQMIRAEEKIKHIILRFGTFYGNETYHTKNLFDQARKGWIPIIGNGENYLNFIHVEDAASAIFYVLENFDRLKNKTLNFSDFSPISGRSFAMRLTEAFGARKVLRIPRLVALIVLGKGLYHFLTDSYRICRAKEISDWQPIFRDFWAGIAGTDDCV